MGIFMPSCGQKHRISVVSLKNITCFPYTIIVNILLSFVSSPKFLAVLNTVAT